VTAPRRRLPGTPSSRRETFWGYVFLAPFIVGFFLWQAYPLLLSLYYSFTNYDLLQPEEWVGLQNYQTMLDDKLFWISLVNTAIYTAMSVGIFLFFSLGGALLLNAKLRGITMFRLVVYLPSQLPLVASAFIFLWIFEPTFGVANYILQTLGLQPQMWLFDPVLAKPTLAIMGIWGIGTGIIIFLAGLQSVPESLYDAAKVDGAGQLRQFWHVTLPMVSPVILFSLIISVIASFQVFDLAYIMTDGGPGTETLFYVLYIFRNGFEFLKMGYASALAWVLFLIVLVLTFINFRASGRWVHYEVSGE
jgi:multiple sugar transport system permease protein